MFISKWPENFTIGDVQLILTGTILTGEIYFDNSFIVPIPDSRWIINSKLGPAKIPCCCTVGAKTDPSISRRIVFRDGRLSYFRSSRRVENILEKDCIPNKNYSIFKISRTDPKDLVLRSLFGIQGHAFLIISNDGRYSVLEIPLDDEDKNIFCGRMSCDGYTFFNNQ